MRKLTSIAVLSALLISLGNSGTASAKQKKAKIFTPHGSAANLTTGRRNTSALLTEQCTYTNQYVSHCTVYKEDGSKYGEYCVDNDGKTISCP